MVDEKPEAVEQVQEKDCSAAGSEETSGNAKSLGVFSFEGDMSLAQAIPLGLQHVLAMFVGNLTPLLIVTGACGLAGAEFADVQLSLLQNAMWIAGVVTLVQLFGIGPVGGRVPIIMGTSSGFIGVFNSVAASKGGGLLAYGALMGASIIGFCCSIPTLSDSSASEGSFPCALVSVIFGLQSGSIVKLPCPSCPRLPRRSIVMSSRTLSSRSSDF